jgi:hypothetical protein
MELGAYADDSKDRGNYSRSTVLDTIYDHLRAIHRKIHFPTAGFTQQESSVCMMVMVVIMKSCN